MYQAIRNLRAKNWGKSMQFDYIELAML